MKQERSFCEEEEEEGDALSWPLRSYLCNFCGREFGSAQALGGHMNVHRRDRVRLKQSPHAFKNNFFHQNLGKIVRSETLFHNTKTRVFVSPAPLPSSGVSTSFAYKNCLKSDHYSSLSPRRKESVGGKRPRCDEVSFSFLPMKKDDQAGAKRLSQHTTQDLDLELRLGLPLF